MRTAQGAPWVEPGDTALRKDIELLAAFGLIDGPVNQWPLPWKQISRSLHERAQKTYPPHVKQAISRVRAAMPQAEDYRSIGGEVRLSATNEPRLVRGFAGGARAEGDVSASVNKHWRNTYAQVSIGWRDDQFGGDVHFDNSYIAQILFDNWVVYAGTMNQWWGPGWESALLVRPRIRSSSRQWRHHLQQFYLLGRR